MDLKTLSPLLLAALAGAGLATPAAAAAPAPPSDRAELATVVTARDRQAGRQRLRVGVEVTAPAPGWSLRAGARSIAAQRSGDCPAGVTLTPALATTPARQPTGVRGRLPAHRFESARAATTTVRFAGGAVQGDFLVGIAAGTDRLRGRLAAAGGVVRGRPDTTRLRSVELELSGALGARCTPEQRAAVLDELARILDGSPLWWR